MNLRFVTAPGPVRPVRVGWMLNHGNMVNGPLFIPANTEQTFNHQLTLSNDRSLLSICPHMHQLGKSFEVWAEIPGGEVIPLVNIPQWDFHWQLYYTFQHVQVLPAGTVIKSEGVYDNTIFNPWNPNVPPQNVSAGGSTTDEMFLCYFIWSNSQPGDELILMDSTLMTSTPELPAAEVSLRVFPNPTTGMVHFSVPEEVGAALQYVVRDGIGRMVMAGTLHKGSGELLFREDLGHLAPGMYWVELRSTHWQRAVRVLRR
jgi:hypothetical protein